VSLDPPSRLPAAVLAIAAALGLWAVVGQSSAATPDCASFSTQATAQNYFAQRGGGPRVRVGDLDEDRDGVACEGLPGPYKGFASVGYNKEKKFFFGIVSMPPRGTEGYACLYGNKHFDDGPRLLTVFRAQSGPDQAVTEAVGAEADPSSGRLAWKADVDGLTPGRYYAEFEERIRLSPYGGNECPGFSSRAVVLP
jgi:hypothetical protein